MLEISVHAPSQFASVTRQLIQTCRDTQFVHVDVSLPQRDFYDRHLFPLAHCEAELTVEGRIRSIQALESPWETEDALPTLTIMELSPDGISLNSNHGRRGSLVVRMEGEERVLEGENTDVLCRLHTLLMRHDPDILLTVWGDSYLLPRLMTMADRLRLPFALNRNDARPVGAKKPHSYFLYVRIVSHTGARTLSRRLHVDRHNSFALAEMGVGRSDRAGSRRGSRSATHGPHDDRHRHHLDAA